MSKIKIPSIETPTQDVRSLQNALVQMKEAIELMAGLRTGDSPFLLADDLTNTFNDMAVSDTAFQKVFSGRISGVNHVDVNNLGKYGILKIDAALAPATVSDSIHILASATNGATYYTTAGSYAEEIVYGTNTGATVSNTGDTSSPAGWGWRVGGFGGGLQIGAPGVRMNLVLQGMEDSYTTIQGPITYINNTPTLLYGTYWGRIGANINALRFATSGGQLMKGRINIEGVLK